VDESVYARNHLKKGLCNVSSSRERKQLVPRRAKRAQREQVPGLARSKKRVVPACSKGCASSAEAGHRRGWRGTSEASAKKRAVPACSKGCASSAEAGHIRGCRGEIPLTPPAAGEIARSHLPPHPPRGRRDRTCPLTPPAASAVVYYRRPLTPTRPPSGHPPLLPARPPAAHAGAGQDHAHGHGRRRGHRYVHPNPSLSTPPPNSPLQARR
jgi:hypothetical protein